MKIKIFKFVCALIGMSASLPIMASDDGDLPAEPGADPAAPIDNWMLILVFAAITVAAYFIWKQKRKAIA